MLKRVVTARLGEQFETFVKVYLNATTTFIGLGEWGQCAFVFHEEPPRQLIHPIWQLSPRVNVIIV